MARCLHLRAMSEGRRSREHPCDAPFKFARRYQLVGLTAVRCHTDGERPFVTAADPVYSEGRPRRGDPGSTGEMTSENRVLFRLFQPVDLSGL
jgi:hypothetical protein